MKKSIVLAIITCMALLVGCGSSGGSSNPVASTAPTSFVNMNGTLNAPTNVETELLGSILPNTDSQVRNAFASGSATVYVNGVQHTSYEIFPLPSTQDWIFTLKNVPESSTGDYKIDVVTGRIKLKSWVPTAEIGVFKINLHTTAAALLANATGKKQNELLTTYSSFVSNIENDLISAAKLTIASLTGNIDQTASITRKLASDTLFFKDSITFTPEAKVAYLTAENDLDGDGITDLKIEKTVDNNNIKFLTMLSSATSMLSSIASMSQYTDAKLLQDFKDNSTSATRTFGRDASGFALGIYMKKSSADDVYIKLFVRRIDLTLSGTLNGVHAEYTFVKTETTAIATGTKIIMLAGKTAVGGAVTATNFVTDITDPTPSTYTLTYLGTQDGIGSSSGNTRLVKALDGGEHSELSSYKIADEYAVGGGNYDINTKLALSRRNKNRDLLVGDVFCAYFPNIKNYALFKIMQINSDSIKVDYIINTAENENIF